MIGSEDVSNKVILVRKTDEVENRIYKVSYSHGESGVNPIMGKFVSHSLLRLGEHIYKLVLNEFLCSHVGECFM